MVTFTIFCSSQTEGVMCRPEIVPIGDDDEVCIPGASVSEVLHI